MGVRVKTGPVSRRRSLLALALAGLIACIAVAIARRESPTHPAALPPTAVAASIGNQVFLEPEQGFAPVYALLGAARQRLDMTMYELVDRRAEQILGADAARGVRVRVLLDARLERKNNTEAYDYLRQHGVQVFWSNSGFSATHQKSIVIDGSLAAVLTLNLASRYYPTTRDFGVLTTDRADVASIEMVFESDIRGDSVRAKPGDDLVWSPGAEQAFVRLIDGARASVAIESEELTDRDVLEALVRARKRGVAVSLAMTYQQQYAANFTLLSRVGARVGFYRGEQPIYVHAKALVVDAGHPAGRALVGSQNIGAVSLLHDRELGIVLTDPVQIAQVAAVIDRDVAGGRPWSG